MEHHSRIFVSGHTGLVGSAVVRNLKNAGYMNLLLRTHRELDLTDEQAVSDFFESEKPEFVIHAAAKVGGIKANMTYPAEFLYENLRIQNNVIWPAKEAGVKKLLFVSSAVIYPNECPQPIKEEYFMQGAPDPTKAGYAYAKIVGVKLCDYINDEFDTNFISCAPNNLYGEGDNFDPESAHVIPALIRRMHEAKISGSPDVVIWGTGKGYREFLHVDDLASAVVWMMENYNERQFLNIGTGEDITMKDLALLIQRVVDYSGKLVFDASKPEGTARRLFDVSRINAKGWHHTIALEAGLRRTYDWYLKNVSSSGVEQ